MNSTIAQDDTRKKGSFRLILLRLVLGHVVHARPQLKNVNINFK